MEAQAGRIASAHAGGVCWHKKGPDISLPQGRTSGPVLSRVQHLPPPRKNVGTNPSLASSIPLVHPFGQRHERAELFNHCARDKPHHNNEYYSAIVESWKMQCQPTAFPRLTASLF
jgi:hypothetical protein